MKSDGNTYRILAISLSLIVLGGCSFIKREPPLEEKPTAESTESNRPYDPLGLAQDTIVITQVDQSKLSSPAQPPAVSGETVAPSGGGSRISGEITPGAESANSQVFRVQLLTLNSYGEGRRALAVADEMFDQTVSLDFEIPYYKLRVGQFSTKEAAEKYLQRARTAGYPNALIVISTVGIKEAPPIYGPSGSRSSKTQGQPGDSVHADHD